MTSKIKGFDEMERLQAELKAAEAEKVAEEKRLKSQVAAQEG